MYDAKEDCCMLSRRCFDLVHSFTPAGMEDCPHSSPHTPTTFFHQPPLVVYDAKKNCCMLSRRCFAFHTSFTPAWMTNCPHFTTLHNPLTTHNFPGRSILPHPHGAKAQHGSRSAKKSRRSGILRRDVPEWSRKAGPQRCPQRRHCPLLSVSQ